MRSDPAPYRCKLAEAIHLAVTDALRYDSSTPVSPLDLSVPILAVLASEGVVDPAVHADVVSRWNKSQAKVERLEADNTKLVSDIRKVAADALRPTGEQP